MNWRNNQYVRGWFSIPDTLLAVSWIALWIVWPSGVNERIGIRAPSRTTMGYAIIAPSDMKSFSRPDDFIALGAVERKHLEDAKAPEQLIVRSQQPPMLLERQPSNKDAGHAFVTVPSPFPQVDESQLLPPIEGVFHEKADASLHVVIGLSEDLAKHNFRMPEFKFESSEKTAGPWMVVVCVETGEDGQPEHVFLETGCDDKKINDAAVKLVARGRTVDTVARCEGRVTINYGTR